MFVESEHPRDGDGKFVDKNGEYSHLPSANRIAQKIPQAAEENSNKKTQLNIINATNPAPDTYHTWIRSEYDIKTPNEIYSNALHDNEGNENVSLTDDWSLPKWKEAIQKGNITVYSSYPIKNGVFVSPSKQEAMQYSGSGKVYSMNVPLSQVAWIDELQGQFAKPNGYDEFQPSKAKTFTTAKSTTNTKSVVNEIRGDKYYRGDAEYDVFNELPNGWRIEDASLTAPTGYQWANNGQSLFSGKRKRALIKK